ncbi:MAG: zinc-dependent metalloprotease [Gemmatimonadota bacterium]|nr:zinc-dependent metalloprotease [Gemmatimonadota bacterium]MDE2985172.1 zinc-dependent metalloprotease [Gemmatimonadota bacterium]
MTPPLLLFLAFVPSVTPTATAQQPLPPIADKTEGTTAMEGFFNLYWDGGGGVLYWELDLTAGEFLYQISMGSGLGSNPVGIDRGQLRGTHVLEAKRIGPRVLLMQPNYQFQARSDNPTEVQAVRDAFAPSVYWGFDIVARTGDRVLVDATPFFLRDARNVIGQIAQRGEGTFRLDVSRSAIHLPATQSFPENTEVEALLTFTSDNPGGLVSGVAANPRAVTLRQHHSFIQLPDDGYRTRIADPRVGVNGPTIYDYATPIDEDLRLRLAARHRLRKRNPGPEPSEPVEPIVYYLDPGTPEPIRSALIEGAAWWEEAFEAAGFIDAYRVEVLPEGVDPQDIRYNMIHWTHRRTRGYSYGSTVIDPRTGEIIRGVVNLGSLRLRQDYLLGKGMVSPFAGTVGAGGDAAHDPMFCALSAAPGFEYLAQVADNSDAVEMALARVRQLSAHEVGHTIGFPHNYLASTYGRESVMDYPAPYVEIDADGSLDLSNAYVQRIGEYDKLSVNWLYREFPEGTDEAAALEEIVRQGMRDGLIFMAHTNNNFIGAGHPYAGVWDNGENLVDHLEHEIEVRNIGMRNFGDHMIRAGRPMSDLEYVLLPLYMHHRFQLRAAAQSLGGADYRYTVRGDGQTPVAIVPGEEQRDALETILSALTVDFLALPEEVIAMIPPGAFRHQEGEVFPGHTELLFDPLGAAEAAADFTVGEILHPARMARLVVYGSMDDNPNLEEVVDRLVEATWAAPAQRDEYRTRVQHVIQRAVVDRMMRHAGSAGTMTEARAVLSDRLDRLAGQLEALMAASPHQRLVAADIRRWQERIENTTPAPALQLPAGDPIGGNGGNRW